MGRGREDRFGGSKLGHQDRPGTTSPVVARETTVLTIGLQGERPYARRVGSEPSRKSASMIRFPVFLVVFGLSWAAIGQPARAEDVKPGEIKGFDAMATNPAASTTVGAKRLCRGSSRPPRMHRIRVAIRLRRTRTGRFRTRAQPATPLTSRRLRCRTARLRPLASTPRCPQSRRLRSSWPQASRRRRWTRLGSRRGVEIRRCSGRIGTGPVLCHPWWGRCSGQASAR